MSKFPLLKIHSTKKEYFTDLNDLILVKSGGIEVFCNFSHYLASTISMGEFNFVKILCLQDD